MSGSGMNGLRNLALLPPAERARIEASKIGYLIQHKLKGLQGGARQARGRELLAAVPEHVRDAVKAWLVARKPK